ncbi:hypothetical protein N7481_009348 [Penicillium waksmanii]|uniref:uncharacterized protein n=1 Tax=Penicillium waksmanii TaxID=69791 RepID=UPI0025480B8D|nr:uncharacterized protein N7481_009348 [Penicillium waksmanii]KAJ5975641.1 hypothetical protein N7481_009348 [Penicillium waksmanii]
MVKGFIRWYADSTIGRLSNSGKPTVRTTKACAERFFGGFKEATKTEVPEMDRKEIYATSFDTVDDGVQWIKNTLTKDGQVVNEKKNRNSTSKETTF